MTGASEKAHRYFMRFGKGNYRRRFLVKLAKGKTAKVKTSFELANELVGYVREKAPEAMFSGKILTQKPMPGMDGRKKGSSHVYDVKDSTLNEFDEVYFYLVGTKTPEIALKVKTAIPKPGKDAEKIDDTFCSLDIDMKYWDEVHEMLFWDVPKDAKKVVIEHEVAIDEIEIPEGVDDPVQMRALAKRKGKLIRTIDIDGEKQTSEHPFSA